MDFKQLRFDLDLYQINQKGIIERLHPNSIPLEVSNKGWITTDLTNHKIQAESEVLALLTLRGAEGKLGLDFLFFTLSNDEYQSFHKQTFFLEIRVNA